eukprot:1224769-Rhodomonas_salina.1
MGTPQQFQDGNDLPVVQAARVPHRLSQGAAQVRLQGVRFEQGRACLQAFETRQAGQGGKEARQSQQEQLAAGFAGV